MNLQDSFDWFEENIDVYGNDFDIEDLDFEVVEAFDIDFESSPDFFDELFEDAQVLDYSETEDIEFGLRMLKDMGVQTTEKTELKRASLQWEDLLEISGYVPDSSFDSVVSTIIRDDVNDVLIEIPLSCTDTIGLRNARYINPDFNNGEVKSRYLPKMGSVQNAILAYHGIIESRGDVLWLSQRHNISVGEFYCYPIKMSVPYLFLYDEGWGEHRCFISVPRNDTLIMAVHHRCATVQRFATWRHDQWIPYRNDKNGTLIRRSKWNGSRQPLGEGVYDPIRMRVKDWRISYGEIWHVVGDELLENKPLWAAICKKANIGKGRLKKGKPITKPMEVAIKHKIALELEAVALIDEERPYIDFTEEDNTQSGFVTTYDHYYTNANGENYFAEQNASLRQHTRVFHGCEGERSYTHIRPRRSEFIHRYDPVEAGELPELIYVGSEEASPQNSSSLKKVAEWKPLKEVLKELHAKSQQKNPVEETTTIDPLAYQYKWTREELLADPFVQEVNYMNSHAIYEDKEKGDVFKDILRG